MRHVYLLLLTAFLCPCCIQNKTDWKAMYDSLNDDFAEYGAHLQSSVFKLSKDLIDSIHEEGIVAYTS